MKRGTGLIKGVLGVLFLIIVVAGSTCAIYTWAMSEQISATTECFDIKYYK